MSGGPVIGLVVGGGTGELFVAVAVVVALAMLGLSVGVLLRRGQPRGGCGSDCSCEREGREPCCGEEHHQRDPADGDPSPEDQRHSG